MAYSDFLYFCQRWNQGIIYS